MTQVVNMEDIDLFHKRRRKHKTRKGLTFSDSETESDNNSLSEENKDTVSGNVKTTRQQREKRTKNEDSTDESEDEREISSDLDEDEELEDDFWNQARSMSSVPYEPCNFGKGLDFGLPVGMITNMADLFGLFNMDTWRTKLTQEERTLLKGMLPPLPKESDLESVLEELFSNKNFFFGNPITKFFKDLQSGIYHAQVVPYRQNALAMRKADYKHDLRLYVAKLVQAVMNYKMEMGLKDYKELATEGAQDAIQITADMINNEEVSTDDGSGDDDSTKPMEEDKAGKFESDTDTEPEPEEPKKILKGPALEPKEPRIRLPLFFVFRTIRDFFLQFPNRKVSQEYIFEKLGSSTYDDVHTQIPPNFTTSQFFSLALKFLAKHPAAPASNSGSRKPIVEWNANEQTWAWNAVGHDSSDDHLQSLEILFFFAVYRSPGEDFPHLKSLTREKRSVVTIVRTPATLIPQFQQQERKRYETPDKPFVFTVGGTRSIVAPLKRVPNQPADKSKARDHKALKADRPSFVTLLTLVRDAASRLPGGAGTRADVELLLRDSQYLLPDQPETDQREENIVKNLRDLVLHQKDEKFQEVLSSKVSNALDRLKKDKDDPCVQFDDNSKLWVYLHRNRRKGDFVSVPVTCRKKSSS